MIKISILIFFSFCLFQTFAQTVKSIDDMSKKYQTCLDAGKDMLGCSQHFYAQMDSTLNVAYNNLLTLLNSTEKESLKKEQLMWLKKRDTYFKKKDKIFQDNVKKGNWGQDMKMITYDDKANYVKERVIVLIKKIKH